jgi:hypothetical protein
VFEAGPRVATIFARRFNGVSFRPKSGEDIDIAPLNCLRI